MNAKGAVTAKEGIAKEGIVKAGIAKQESELVANET
jgi:hypothetical protein